MEEAACALLYIYSGVAGKYQTRLPGPRCRRFDYVVTLSGRFSRREYEGNAWTAVPPILSVCVDFALSFEDGSLSLYTVSPGRQRRKPVWLIEQCLPSLRYTSKQVHCPFMWCRLGDREGVPVRLTDQRLPSLSYTSSNKVFPATAAQRRGAVGHEVAGSIPSSCEPRSSGGEMHKSASVYTELLGVRILNNDRRSNSPGSLPLYGVSHSSMQRCFVTLNPMNE